MALETDFTDDPTGYARAARELPDRDLVAAIEAFATLERASGVPDASLAAMRDIVRAEYARRRAGPR